MVKKDLHKRIHFLYESALQNLPFVLQYTKNFERGKTMYTVAEFNEIGKEIEQLLYLKTSPIAVKLLKSRDDIPEGCYVPSVDKNERPALCQAFAQVRRNRRSMAMFKEDHWCVWPLVSFRLGEVNEDDIDYLGRTYFIKDPEASVKYFRANFPMIKEELAAPGMAIAPLASCTFEPDAVVVYCVPDQLRQLLMASKYRTAAIAGAALDTVGSCVNALVPVLNGTQDYCTAIPDPGEYERSLAGDNELIFVFRGDKTEELIGGMRDIDKMGFGYHKLAMDMNLEYPRAEFYNVMFNKWGLKTGDSWDLER